MRIHESIYHAPVTAHSASSPIDDNDLTCFEGLPDDNVDVFGAGTMRNAAVSWFANSAVLVNHYAMVQSNDGCCYIRHNEWDAVTKRPVYVSALLNDTNKAYIGNDLASPLVPNSPPYITMLSYLHVSM